MAALANAAIEDLEQRLAEADLDRVPVSLAIERMARAIIASGTKFAVVIDVRQHFDMAELDRRIGEPIRVLFRRGVVDGTLRDDLSIDLLTGFWGASLESVLRSTVRLEVGTERASAAVTSFFLDGAGRR
jgi:hypothetical protein